MRITLCLAMLYYLDFLANIDVGFMCFEHPKIG